LLHLFRNTKLGDEILQRLKEGPSYHASAVATGGQTTPSDKCQQSPLAGMKKRRFFL